MSHLLVDYKLFKTFVFDSKEYKDQVIDHANIAAGILKKFNSSSKN